MGFVVSELPPDSIEMCLVELQNPSTMWLVDVINKQISKKFYDMEERLKEVLVRGKPQYCNRMLNVGDIVAVYDPVSSAWCRAKICDIYQKLAKYVYSVFLVDRGYSISSDSTNVKELPPEASTLQFRCYHIQLYGIIPISPSNTIASPENIELQCWLPEAVDDVKKLLDTCEAVYFTPKVARRTVYGDIYLKFDYGFVHLANYLCNKEFAVYNTNSFDLMMETAPYMSCQKGFSANNNKDNRSITDYINANRATNDTSDFQEESWSVNPCSGTELASSVHNSEDKSVEIDNTSSSESGTKESRKRKSALQQYYEKMRQADRYHAELDHRTILDKEAGVKQTAQKRHFPAIGRGQRLQILQKLTAEKKPGGSCSSKSPSDEASDKFEDEDMLVDKLSNMSVCGNKSPEYSEKHIFGRNMFTDTVSDGKKTKMGDDRPKHPSQFHTDKQHITKQTVPQANLPMSTGNIFCRTSKLVFLPAGSEMSMLVAKKKARRYPDQFK